MLDYSAYTATPVIVDMASGQAMNINGNATNGFSGIETPHWRAKQRYLWHVRQRYHYLWLDNTLVTGGTDDSYVFRPGWGIETVIELPNGGNDTMDFSPS